MLLINVFISRLKSSGERYLEVLHGVQKVIKLSVNTEILQSEYSECISFINSSDTWCIFRTSLIKLWFTPPNTFLNLITLQLHFVLSFKQSLFWVTRCMYVLCILKHFPKNSVECPALRSCYCRWSYSLFLVTAAKIFDNTGCRVSGREFSGFLLPPFL